MIVVALLTLALTVGQPPAAEVLAQVQVHGNMITPEADVLAIAAVTPGMPFDANTASLVEQRLRDSGRFERVEVRKRFASIADPAQVLLVIIVDEGRAGINWHRAAGEAVRTMRRGGLPFMLAPVLKSEDGYGLTYGVRLALPRVAGAQSGISVPLTWGGEKQAAVEITKEFAGSALDRLAGGVSVTRRTNPHYDEPGDRQRAWVRAEREVFPRVRIGAAIASERAQFRAFDDRYIRAGADVVVDTRLDPFLSRNAIYARAGVERLGLSSAPLVRSELEAQAHVGLFGQSLLVVRGRREDASGAQPPYLQPLMGGMSNLRGFEAGFAAGDTLVAGTMEARVPLTSPLNVGKVGVSGFVDVATVYRDGARLADAVFERGVGGSVWLSLAVVRMELSVARGLGRSTRVHFGANVTF